MTPPLTIGRFDPELFARFRAAEGPERRGLLNRLVIENEPLVKLLVAKLLKRETKVQPRRGKRTWLGGLRAPELIDWEDAMQAGRIGMAKCFERFDPTKGKLSPYAEHKIRYELQCVEDKDARIHIPRGREEFAPKGFDSLEDIGGEEKLESIVGDGLDDEDSYAPDLTAANDVDPWVETTVQKGEAIEPELAPLERFLAKRCAFLPPARIAKETMVCAFERFMRLLGERVHVRKLVDGLEDRGAKVTMMRVDWSANPVQAFARVRLNSDRFTTNIREAS